MMIEKLYSIKSKLTLIAIGVAFVLGIIGILAFVYLDKKQDMENLSASLNAFIVDMMELRRSQNDFLLKERNSISFLESGKSEYFVISQKNYEINKLHIKEIAENPVSKVYGLERPLNKISINLKAFHTNFLELRAAIIERGAPGYGLIGELISSPGKMFGLAKYLRL
jgi:hypothetical protein